MNIISTYNYLITHNAGTCTLSDICAYAQYNTYLVWNLIQWFDGFDETNSINHLRMFVHKTFAHV